jgi:hypothetical protein
MNRLGTGRVQHQAANVAMPGTARTSGGTAPIANRGNSFRNANTGMIRAKAKAAQESPEDDQDDEGHDDREPLLTANDAEIDDPTTDDDGKLIGHDPEEDDGAKTFPKSKKAKS